MQESYPRRRVSNFDQLYLSSDTNLKKTRYKTLHLYAMTAAIPHLVLLATSLPDVLPYAKDEIRIDYYTGTVQCVDEVLPSEIDDEDQFDEEPEIKLGGELVTRLKSRLEVKICIGNGEREITGREKKVRRRRGKIRGLEYPQTTTASSKEVQNMEHAMGND
jgi:hypothetical protein